MAEDGAAGDDGRHPLRQVGRWAIWLAALGAVAAMIGLAGMLAGYHLCDTDTVIQKALPSSTSVPPASTTPSNQSKPDQARSAPPRLSSASAPSVREVSETDQRTCKTVTMTRGYPLASFIIALILIAPLVVISWPGDLSVKVLGVEVLFSRLLDKQQRELRRQATEQTVYATAALQAMPDQPIKSADTDN